MIMNIYTNADGSLGATLPVFDGVEIGVDQVRKASEHINKAVYKGWMGANIYRSIGDGFRQMMLRLYTSTLSPETIKELARTLQLKKGESFSDWMLWDIQQNMNNLADQVDARKEAMSKINSWVDHMAGVGSPHNNPGERVSEEEVLDRLNELYV